MFCTYFLIGTTNFFVPASDLLLCLDFLKMSAHADVGTVPCLHKLDFRVLIYPQIYHSGVTRRGGCRIF